MQAFSDSRSNLELKSFADDGSNKGLQEPSQACKLGLAQCVVEVMDVDLDVAQGHNLFQAILADFQVESDINTALVEMESSNTLVDHSEKTRVKTEPVAQAGQQGIKVVSNRRLGSQFVGLFAQSLESLLDVVEKVRIAKHILHHVSNLFHEFIKVGISLSVIDNSIEGFLDIVPMFTLAERSDEQPEIVDCLVGFWVGFGVLLNCFHCRNGCMRVGKEVQNSILETLDKGIAFIAFNVLLDALCCSIGYLKGTILDSFTNVCNFILEILI
ncbi:hypothetical protein HG531_007584 [Fusarium graminearum]|nr:hypothetical protein HG531_007584 [Fusarium graminearum]